MHVNSTLDWNQAHFLFTVLNVTWVVYEKIALQNYYSEEEKKNCAYLKNLSMFNTNVCKRFEWNNMTNGAS